MDFIVKHPSYDGMPSPYKDDGSIRWIVAGASEIGKTREAWWDKKRADFGIKKEAGWKAKVALKLHPTGEKPCQVCGRILKLDYVYPNKICKKNRDSLKECDTKNCDLFNTRQCKEGYRGPGAMSDCPDRFDGFHTYNRCCRSKEDTGRHIDNLSRYGEDRRAYEFWSDGDWKQASWLMQEFRKHNLSPDHIGPISLGFCHRPKFKPMTTAENTAKGNRLSLNDIKELLIDESSGISVVSEHSRPIWDLLKNNAKTDGDAKLISKLMRLNMHKIFTIFATIADAGFADFLTARFLHPEYALFQYEFEDFDKKTGVAKIKKLEASRTEHKRNALRYVRKSFDALKRYLVKENRHAKYAMSAKEQILTDSIIKSLSLGDTDRAYVQLKKLLHLWANSALLEFVSMRTQA